MNPKLENLLVTWYADDFTGAAAVLEVLAFAGVNAMLFLDVPTDEQLARYPDLEAIGIASTARAQTPAWMERHLPPVFQALLELNAPLLHYKICTTLDSSPQVGSIGRVVEIAANLLNPDAIPVLVAAPQMRRYQIFGHLFAAHGDNVFRLDRHPVMARHPVTPMQEADVAQHIAIQSNKLQISNWSLEDIAAGRQPGYKSTDSNIAMFTIDCVDDASEAAAGRLLWEGRQHNKFIVGSQGVEFALVRHWVATGRLLEQKMPNGVGRANGMLTVSGSVSPTTAEQIGWAIDHGFTAIRFDVHCACGNTQDVKKEIMRVVKLCLSALEKNTDPLVFTAQGPDDPAVQHLQENVASLGLDMADVNRTIGVALGGILHDVLTQSSIRRAVVSGGDTSGFVTQQLGIFALSALAPTIAGASLSKVHANGPIDGLELALKGGQMGSADYFGWIRDGGGIR